MDKKTSRLRRARRARARIRELAIPRLTVHRTPRHIYAQVIAADGGTVLAAASTIQEEKVLGDGCVKENCSPPPVRVVLGNRGGQSGQHA